MRVLALSGSLRAASRSTALLRALAAHGDVRLYGGLAGLPMFSPDLEGPPAPVAVEALLAEIAAADAMVFAAPEYVHALPGGLKNAIDWCVSRPEIIHKPIAIAHASHRGDDMLADLRRVLGTVTSRFARDIFLRLPIAALPAEAVAGRLAAPETAAAIARFLDDLRLWAEPDAA